MRRHIFRQLFVAIFTLVLLIVFQYWYTVKSISFIGDGYLTSDNVSNVSAWTPQGKTTFRKHRNVSTRYLWCVNHYGPNNQLKDFMKCCVIAMTANFTLIIPPLYPHYLDKIQAIQHFGHFYDLEKLSEALDFITLKQFIQQTPKGENKTMMGCHLQQVKLDGHMIYYANNALKIVENYYKTQISFYHEKSLSSSPSFSEIAEKVDNCTSVYLNIHYLALHHLSSATNTHVKSIFPHLHRTPLIQRIASKLINVLPNLVIGNITKNNLTILAVVHFRLGDRVVMNVSMYIHHLLLLIQSGVHFTHVHIMCPYLSPADVSQLAHSLPVPITTSQILSNRARFLVDDYFFNVLEQEIAFQAPIFIASPWTTYSATVVLQKLYQNRGAVHIFPIDPKNRTYLVNKQNANYYNK